MSDLVTSSKRVTLRQLAERAGVSVTTASDSLRGRGRVQAATRQRLIDLADELGYRPNASARSLRRGTANSIGLYLPDDVITMPYYMDLAQGAAEGAAAGGLALTLIPAWRDVDRIASFPIDGLIIVDPVLGDPVLEQLSALRMPVVSCERDLSANDSYAGSVTIDHAPAIRELLEHLSSRGAQSIAFLVPPGTTSWAVEIRSTYLAWCEEQGAEPLLRTLLLAASPYDVRREVDSLFDEDIHPDAIISAHDGGAIGALMAASERGLSIPNDLLIASGVDSATLQLCSPAITAINLHPRMMGRQAAEMLVHLVLGDQTGETWVKTPTKLEIRESTKSSGRLHHRSRRR